jgi:cytochrome c biogenesis factor
VQVGTLVLWLWIGGFIMAIGTAVALVPVRRWRVLEREVAAAPHDDEAPSLVEVSS